jgi:hypothetical protein
MQKKREKALGAESASAERPLQQIANCLGYFVVHTEGLKGKSNNDLIPILASLSFERNSIASILQTTPKTVSECLSRLKAKTSSKDLSKS